jgi:hypothetical protein
MRIIHYKPTQNAPIVCGLSRKQFPKLFATTDRAIVGCVKCLRAIERGIGIEAAATEAAVPVTALATKQDIAELRAFIDGAVRQGRGDQCEVEPESLHEREALCRLHRPVGRGRPLPRQAARDPVYQGRHEAAVRQGADRSVA